MNRQLVEIASWKIVSELTRRYPGKFTVLETHPGGGQYDCLSLYDKKQEHIASFNRAGRFHVFASFDGIKQREPYEIWPAMNENYDQKNCSRQSFRRSGIARPGKTPGCCAGNVGLSVHRCVFVPRRVWYSAMVLC